jgi:hypothetical protein
MTAAGHALQSRFNPPRLDAAHHSSASDEQTCGSRRQIAFEHDALVLLVDALYPVARIARVAIGLRHQLPYLILSGRRRAKNSWNKIDGLPDREFMRQKKSFPIFDCSAPAPSGYVIGACWRLNRYGDDTDELIGRICQASLSSDQPESGGIEMADQQLVIRVSEY